MQSPSEPGRDEVQPRPSGRAELSKSRFSQLVPQVQTASHQSSQTAHTPGPSHVPFSQSDSRSIEKKRKERRESKVKRQKSQKRERERVPSQRTPNLGELAEQQRSSTAAGLIHLTT